MFNLSTASIGIRKAAALQGIRSGKWEPIFSEQSDSGLPHDESRIIAKVYNKNHPDGIEISNGEALYADHLNWSEINSQ